MYTYPLGQVSYGGVQLQGWNPYPSLGKGGLKKHSGISQSQAPEAVRTPKTYPILGKNLIMPGTWSGLDSENMPYLGENPILQGTRRGMSHWVNNLFRLTKRRGKKITSGLLALCEENPPVIGPKRTSDVKSVSMSSCVLWSTSLCFLFFVTGEPTGHLCWPTDGTGIRPLFRCKNYLMLSYPQHSY